MQFGLVGKLEVNIIAFFKIFYKFCLPSCTSGSFFTPPDVFLLFKIQLYTQKSRIFLAHGGKAGGKQQFHKVKSHEYSMEPPTIFVSNTVAYYNEKFFVLYL